MKTQIIKLTDKFILVSDEAINIGDWAYNADNDYFIIDEEDDLTYVNGTYHKIIAGIPGLPTIDLSLIFENFIFPLQKENELLKEELQEMKEENKKLKTERQQISELVHELEKELASKKERAN